MTRLAIRAACAFASSNTKDFVPISNITLIATRFDGGSRAVRKFETNQVLSSLLVSHGQSFAKRAFGLLGLLDCGIARLLDWVFQSSIPAIEQSSILNHRCGTVP